MTYHIGLLRNKRTLVIQASQNVDCLSCEITEYMGLRETTKKQLHQNRYAILNLLKREASAIVILRPRVSVLVRTCNNHNCLLVAGASGVRSVTIFHAPIKNGAACARDLRSKA